MPPACGLIVMARRRGVSMAYSTVYRMVQTLCYVGLLHPAERQGRHPAYRPSAAILDAWLEHGAEINLK